MEHKFSVHFLNGRNCLIDKFKEINGGQLIEDFLVHDVVFKSATLCQLLDNDDIVVLILLDSEGGDDVFKIFNFFVSLVFSVCICPAVFIIFVSKFIVGLILWLLPIEDL